jgi:hypothetical protein
MMIEPENVSWIGGGVGTGNRPSLVALLPGTLRGWRNSPRWTWTNDGYVGLLLPGSGVSRRSFLYFGPLDEHAARRVAEQLAESQN